MLASAIPTKFPIPFGNSANPATIRVVPTASQIGIQDGAASLTDGFPIKTQTPVGAGGTPPYGQDMNGILFQATAWLQWVNAGAPIKYDAAFQTAIGGYPQGAVVQSATYLGLFWFSLVDNNTTNPDAGGAGWTNFCRIRLNADLTLFVSTTGSNSNNGLTIGAPFLTIQKAMDVLYNNYDLNGFSCTIQLADGTYTSGVSAAGPMVGQKFGSSITVAGNTASPLNVVINGGSGAVCIGSNNGSYISCKNMVLAGGYGLVASSGGQIAAGVGMSFGACAQSHIQCNYCGIVILGNDYAISGAAVQSHITVTQGGVVIMNSTGLTCTLSGTPSFSNFVFATTGGNVLAQTIVFAGSGATGSRYGASMNGVIQTNGGGANYLPGSIAGTLTTGGQYA